MLMPTANNHIRSLKYLHAEKNDEKFRQTFGGMEIITYLCSRKVKLSKRNMKKTYVLNQLSMLKGKLSDYGVSSIGLFGSTVRDENRPDSDIDILVDFSDGKETYDNFMSVCDLLQSTFKRSKLDVVTKKGLSPYIEPIILNETRYV